MSPLLLADIGKWFQDLAPTDWVAWIFLIIGFIGQVIFGSRFLVQWIASERKGKSHFPLVFWYLSIMGGMLLFTYACSRRDPIIMMGQSANMIVYIRNLMLIGKRKRERERKAAEGIPMCLDPHCGKENPHGASFCAFCGKPLIPTPDNDAEAPAAPPADPDAS